MLGHLGLHSSDPCWSLVGRGKTLIQAAILSPSCAVLREAIQDPDLRSNLKEKKKKSQQTTGTDKSGEETNCSCPPGFRVQSLPRGQCSSVVSRLSPTSPQTNTSPRKPFVSPPSFGNSPLPTPSPPLRSESYSSSFSGNLGRDLSLLSFVDITLNSTPPPLQAYSFLHPSPRPPQSLRYAWKLLLSKTLQTCRFYPRLLPRGALIFSPIPSSSNRFCRSCRISRISSRCSSSRASSIYSFNLFTHFMLARFLSLIYHTLKIRTLSPSFIGLFAQAHLPNVACWLMDVPLPSVKEWERLMSGPGGSSGSSP